MHKSIIQSVVFFGTIIFLWWFSSYKHESDIIRQCELGKSYQLFHSDYEVENCLIRRK